MTNTSQQIGASIGTALLNTIAAAATATYLAVARTRSGTASWPRRRCTATPWPARGWPGSSSWPRCSPGCSSTCIRGSRWRTHPPRTRTADTPPHRGLLSGSGRVTRAVLVERRRQGSCIHAEDCAAPGSEGRPTAAACQPDRGACVHFGAGSRVHRLRPRRGCRAIGARRR